MGVGEELERHYLWRYSLPPARRTKMAFEVATATLENKAGEKVAASEALKGKVIALYVRLALPRTAPWRECAVAIAELSPCAS